MRQPEFQEADVLQATVRAPEGPVNEVRPLAHVPGVDISEAIEELGLIAGETQTLAKVLKWTLGDLQRELAISAAGPPQAPPSGEGALSSSTGALGERIQRLKRLGREINALLMELVQDVRFRLAARSRLSKSDSSPKDLRTRVEEFERAAITAALQECGGSQRLAASALGVLPTTLHEKLRRLGLRALVRHERVRRPKQP